MEELQSLADLLDLQEVDSAIDKLLDDRQNLPALQDYKTAHATTLAKKKALDTAVAEHREIALEEDKLEGELEMGEARLEQQERRLFAGGMSAKETENMRQDVASLRISKSKMEDRVIELLDLREAAEAAVVQAEKELATATAEEKELEEMIGEAWKSIDAMIARKEARKAEVVPSVDPDLLELYTDLRNRRGGVVVGALEHNTCGACHLELSAAEHHEAIKEHPPRCIHCGAILVP
jgi:predicted  nucleic acid-binding Zn-ribbon protein